ncbi:MAG TPA: head GIN domain-containing protein [Flavobacterium sp.]|jgi:hypothetical protein
MKNLKALLFLFISIVVVGCNISEDCIKSSGAITTKSFAIDAIINNIYVFPGVGLVLTDGPEQSITVTAGENFIDDVSVTVEGNSLMLKDNSGCNLTRAYGQVTVNVTAPDIVEIISNTEQTIRSNGVLTYPLLRLYSLDIYDGVGSGDFVMDIQNNGQLVVQSNHVSAFYITGHTKELLLNFYNGNGRFEGRNFVADSIKLFHRGANDMTIHPIKLLKGDIYSTGNVISTTHPETVEVEEHYSGRLIFE